MADSRLSPVSPLRRFLIHPLQALGAYFVFALVGLLPLDAASALGGWLGRTVGPHLGISRRARRNLERAFPEKSDAEIEAILCGMWDNLGRTFLEYPHLNRLRFHQDDGHVEVVGVEYLDGLRDDGRPGIVFSGHLANWEVVPLSAVHRGLPIHLIYRAPNNPWTERLFRRPHPSEGGLLPKGLQGARRALKLLSEGGHLGILVDQKMNNGIPVPFFGRDAMTAPALARFALKYDCPVIPLQVERIKGARFRITNYPPLTLRRSDDREADVAAIMTEVNAIIEGWIRKNPEQWLWLHNRWPD